MMVSYYIKSRLNTILKSLIRNVKLGLVMHKVTCIEKNIHKC